MDASQTSSAQPIYGVNHMWKMVHGIIFFMALNYVFTETSWYHSVVKKLLYYETNVSIVMSKFKTHEVKVSVDNQNLICLS